MPCDLERLYGKLAEQLPDGSEEGEPFALNETVIPAVPPEISTDKLLIYRGSLERLPGCRGDQLDIVAPRQTFRQLGLLALAVLFHEQCDRAAVHNQASTTNCRQNAALLECKLSGKCNISRQGTVMPCDLERLYGKLAEQLPDSSEEGEPFALNETVIPAVPPEISTDKLLQGAPTSCSKVDWQVGIRAKVVAWRLMELVRHNYEAGVTLLLVAKTLRWKKGSHCGERESFGRLRFYR